MTEFLGETAVRLLTMLFHSLLVLAGCTGPGGSTHVTRTVVDGRDLVHSEVWVGERVARFDCRDSASGRCHYLLYRDGCDQADADSGCAPRAFERFAVARGDRRELLGLPAGFSMCVSDRAVRLPQGCTAR